ncbi:MAG: signal peptide peptidase SppA [Minisyncoccota bacterium]
MKDIPPLPLFARYLLAGIALVVCLGVTTLVTGRALLKEQQRLSLPSDDFSTADGRGCDIAVIPMVGELWASEANASAQTAADSSANVSAEYILQQIERAKGDHSIKGVVLRVDSPGGSGVAGSLIANALKRLGKPSVALIGDQGDSAAYWAATGATAIIASPDSEVGDIGITGSYLDQSGSNEQSGKKFISITAGAYKDVGNPDNPLTPEGQAFIQKQVDEMYQNFLQEVARNRSMSVDAVRRVADGVSYVASTATSTGLIDALGDSETARVWFKQKLGAWSDPVLCE